MDNDHNGTGNWYLRACKFTSRNFGWLVGDVDAFAKKSEQAVSQEYKDALSFIGFDVEPFETALFSYVGALGALIIALFMDVLLFQITTFESNVLVMLAVLTVAIPVIVLLYLSEYVKIHAKLMKVQSLGDIPEVLSYIVMAMKLVPNMERAVLFAAKNSTRPLARDLKKMMWNLQIRVYSSMDDAVVDFANLWGKDSEYFKRALHLIKSSTSEPDDAQRIITLNRALDIVLDGTKVLMDGFAAKLKTPTYVLYSIFILIPLALVALLPAVTVVGLRFNILTLVIVYDIALPLLTFLYAEYILMQRPAAFTPQSIPDTHPELVNIKTKKRVALIAALIIGGAISISGYVTVYLGNPHGIISTGTLEGLLPPTLIVLLGMVVAIAIYLNAAYSPYKKIRDNIRKMEHEFADALFILGRRISEGRSAEEAFAHTAMTMKGSAIGDAFGKISTNLISMRATITSAIFDEDFGAFKDIYSDRIRTTMLLFAESVHKSHEAAGVAIIKLADHLKELQEVELNIKRSLYDMTSTMRSTAAIFAPLIGGVTIALSEVIQKILQNVAEGLSRLPPNMIPGPAQINPENLSQSISPDLFMLSIGIYLMLVTAILTRFSGTIEYGGDKPQLMYDLGQMLPFSVVVFTVSAIASRLIFRGLI
ncbi:MAG: hypothetical protein Q7J10_05860 [Methanosarcinaceae archaeon]|nr:hypothetical protein [Methanosarcinaceae archaeon]